MDGVLHSRIAGIDVCSLLYSLWRGDVARVYGATLLPGCADISGGDRHSRRTAHSHRHQPVRRSEGFREPAWDPDVCNDHRLVVVYGDVCGPGRPEGRGYDRKHPGGAAAGRGDTD